MYTKVKLTDGKTAKIPIRQSHRARRIIIRVIQNNPGLEIVIPSGKSLRSADLFAQSKSEWIEARLKERLANIPIKDGTELPFLDGTIVLYSLNAATSNVSWFGNKLIISGQNNNFEDIAIATLKTEAKKIIKPHAKYLASLVNKEIISLKVGDPVSQWGSCSSKGHLSFSWRLLMAPKSVLNYVICHEVSHLVELNHGPAFWKTVDKLCKDAAYAKTWLQHKGAHLRRYGTEKY
ncbi:MAG: hypothetical protein CMD67_05850 [Gammaproteobacteria bacterium]|nr:hypothetical protein [Gammaproteobacteria bacterium]